MVAKEKGRQKGRKKERTQISEHIYQKIANFSWKEYSKPELSEPKYILLQTKWGAWVDYFVEQKQWASKCFEYSLYSIEHMKTKKTMCGMILIIQKR